MSLSDNDTGGFKEKNLTERGHNDPDKHWIGESLAPPSQTEIAATVGSTAGPGDSPFVARADHTHKLGTSVVGPTNVSYGIFNLAIHGSWRTFLDDEAAYIDFSPVGLQYGIFVIGSNSGSGPLGIYAFRTGDASAYCTMIAQSSALTVTLGVGALLGTTGVDGQITIRAWNTTSFARVYLENRSGVSRAYGITFISLASGSITPSLAWVVA